MRIFHELSEMSKKRRAALLTFMLTVLVMLAAVTKIAFLWRKAKNEAAAWMEAIASVTEPEHCALCSYDMTYHAPALVNLSTGRILELQIYDPHPVLYAEVIPARQLDVIRTFFGAGLFAVSDPGGENCRTTVPTGGDAIDLSLYCRNCRNLLTKAGTKGYVIADLHDLDSIQVFPIENGAEYEIRIYSVTVSPGPSKGQHDVLVTGHLRG